MTGTWRDLFPNGRCIFYEGADPEMFVTEMKTEFGFDPSDDPNWGHGVTHGPNGERFPDPLGRPYSFHCPPEHLDAIYTRWPMGS